MKQVLIAISLAIFVSIPCSADLVIKMTADDTTLGLGDSTFVHVEAWVDDAAATGDNGLVLWQMDLDVDNAGVIGSSNLTITAPIDIYDSSGFTSPLNGAVNAYALKNDDMSSTIGVGGFTELFNFEVTGLSVGTVEYSIGSTLLGDLADFTAFDISYDTAFFDTAASDNVLTVVPEPASISLFAIMSGFIFRRRK